MELVKPYLIREEVMAFDYTSYCIMYVCMYVHVCMYDVINDIVYVYTYVVCT